MISEVGSTPLAHTAAARELWRWGVADTKRLHPKRDPTATSAPRSAASGFAGRSTIRSCTVS